MEHGWQGPGVIGLSDGTPLLVFALSVAERGRYEAWINAWISCAKDRGTALDEANK